MTTVAVSVLVFVVLFVGLLLNETLDEISDQIRYTRQDFLAELGKLNRRKR